MAGRFGRVDAFCGGTHSGGIQRFPITRAIALRSRDPARRALGHGICSSSGETLSDREPDLVGVRAVGGFRPSHLVCGIRSARSSVGPGECDGTLLQAGIAPVGRRVHRSGHEGWRGLGRREAETGRAAVGVFSGRMRRLVIGRVDGVAGGREEAGKSQAACFIRRLQPCGGTGSISKCDPRVRTSLCSFQRRHG